MCAGPEAVSVVGEYESVGRTADARWPSHIIEEIVSGSQPCMLSDKINHSIRGASVIVYTPATSPLQNSDLAILLGIPSLESIEMFVKVFSRDITALKLKNENLFLRTSVQENALVPHSPIPYVHAKRAIQCSSHLPCFKLPHPREYPLYPCENQCLSYGVTKKNIESSGWNIAALSVMFDADCFVMMYQEENETCPKRLLLPVFVGQSTLRPRAKCITYAYDAEEKYQTIVVEMPNSTSNIEHSVEAVYYHENGEMDPFPFVMQMGRLKNHIPRDHVYNNEPYPMSEDGSTENILLRLRYCDDVFLHIEFIPVHTVAAFLASKSPVQRSWASALFEDEARLAQIRELQRQRNAKETDYFFPSGTQDNVLFAQYQQQVRETGNPPHSSGISPETRAMLDRLQAKQQQDAREKMILDNSRLNDEAMQRRRRQCTRELQAHQEAHDRKVEETRQQHRALMAEQMAARELEQRARHDEQEMHNRKLQEIKEERDRKLKNEQVKKDQELRHLKEMYKLTGLHNAMLKEQVQMQNLLRSAATTHEAHQIQIDSVIAQRGNEIAAQEAKQFESDQCLICMENPKNVVAVPCGHRALCQECSRKCPNKCSICRQNVDKWVRIFDT